MHEITLARNIIETLEAELSQDQLINLQGIDLKVGKLSNVEPLLMQNAFKAVTQAEARFQSVQLNIELVPIKIYCETCVKETLIENYRFFCSCGRHSNQVVSGTELLIKRLHFKDSAE